MSSVYFCIGNNGNINLQLFSICSTQIRIFWTPDTCLVHQVTYTLTFHTRFEIKFPTYCTVYVNHKLPSQAAVFIL